MNYFYPVLILGPRTALYWNLQAGWLGLGPATEELKVDGKMVFILCSSFPNFSYTHKVFKIVVIPKCYLYTYLFNILLIINSFFI